MIFPYSVLIFKGEKSPATLRRAIDGNYYSLDLVRSDEVPRKAVTQGTDPTQRSAEARTRFRRLLDAPEPQYADIYEYWRRLEHFWQRIDYHPKDSAVLESDNVEPRHRRGPAPGAFDT